MKKIMQFFLGVKKEMKRVRWPNKEHMFKYSVATIVSVIFFSSFFYLIYIIITYIKTLG
ncbi:MAG: preprotein translocase subunit SecE [Bacilli bacterium]|nr:preprotein translocase subunit SecE [Bacilli bacterium]